MCSFVLDPMISSWNLTSLCLLEICILRSSWIELNLWVKSVETFFDCIDVPVESKAGEISSKYSCLFSPIFLCFLRNQTSRWNYAWAWAWACHYSSFRTHFSLQSKFSHYAQISNTEGKLIVLWLFVCIDVGWWNVFGYRFSLIQTKNTQILLLFFHLIRGILVILFWIFQIRVLRCKKF